MYTLQTDRLLLFPLFFRPLEPVLVVLIFNKGSKIQAVWPTAAAMSAQPEPASSSAASRLDEL